MLHHYFGPLRRHEEHYIYETEYVRFFDTRDKRKEKATVPRSLLSRRLIVLQLAHFFHSLITAAISKEAKNRLSLKIDIKATSMRAS